MRIKPEHITDFNTHVVIYPKWFLDMKDQRATYRLNIKTKEAAKIK